MDELTDEFDRVDNVDIGVLLADPGADSEVFARWSERLGQYVQGQGALDALRLRPDTDAPWPQRDNPMLCYLIERAAELVEHDGIDVAIAWLAMEAWLEATIAERSRLSRLLVDDC
jgi:hypothetical protein